MWNIEIFSNVNFQTYLQAEKGDEELCSVYVPTNHVYIGDIFLVNSSEIIRPNLSIREGIGLTLSLSVYPSNIYTSDCIHLSVSSSILPLSLSLQLSILANSNGICSSGKKCLLHSTPILSLPLFLSISLLANITEIILP